MATNKPLLQYPPVTTFDTINGTPIGVRIGRDYVLNKAEAEAMVRDMQDAISKLETQGTIH